MRVLTFFVDSWLSDSCLSHKNNNRKHSHNTQSPALLLPAKWVKHHQPRNVYCTYSTTLTWADICACLTDCIQSHSFLVRLLALSQMFVCLFVCFCGFLNTPSTCSNWNARVRHIHTVIEMMFVRVRIQVPNFDVKLSAF